MSDPRHPVQVGSWGAWRDLGIERFPSKGSFPFNFVHSVITNEATARAYLSYWDLGTVILDISNPASPRFLGRTTYRDSEEGNAHSAWLATGGNVLIQTDEDFDPRPGSILEDPIPGLEQAWGYARIFDSSRPSSPRQIGTFKMPSTTQFPPPVGDYTVHDPKVRGSSLYLSYYSEGVVVTDISRPANPRFVAQFVPEASEDPFGLFNPGVAFPFIWGVFPTQNFVLASDINNGLWIFQVR